MSVNIFSGVVNKGYAKEECEDKKKPLKTQSYIFKVSTECNFINRSNISLGKTWQEKEKQKEYTEFLMDINWELKYITSKLTPSSKTRRKKPAYSKKSSTTKKKRLKYYTKN